MSQGRSSLFASGIIKTISILLKRYTETPGLDFEKKSEKKKAKKKKKRNQETRCIIIYKQAGQGSPRDYIKN